MIEIKRRWASVADREKWAARGAAFVAKAKATKAVWFPPEPAQSGKKAASTAKKATKRTTKKATKRPTRKTAAAAKKTTQGRKNASAG